MKLTEIFDQKRESFEHQLLIALNAHLTMHDTLPVKSRYGKHALQMLLNQDRAKPLLYTGKMSRGFVFDIDNNITLNEIVLRGGVASFSKDYYTAVSILSDMFNGFINKRVVMIEQNGTGLDIQKAADYLLSTQIINGDHKIFQYMEEEEVLAPYQNPKIVDDKQHYDTDGEDE